MVTVFACTVAAREASSKHEDGGTMEVVQEDESEATSKSVDISFISRMS